MNAITNLVAIASLLLALATAGTVVNKQTDVDAPAASRNITPSKLGANHNETMVSDAALVQQEDTLSEWLMNLHTSVFTRFAIYLPTGGPCEDWGCGTNHNETLVSDAKPIQQSDTGSAGLRGEQAFGFGRVLLYPNIAGCPVWMCGTNHNETIVRDVAR